MRLSCKKMSMISRRMLLATVATFCLSACSMDTPTTLTEKRVQVFEETYHTESFVAGFGEQEMSLLAQDYADQGEGSVALTVTYDPKDKTNNAAAATDSAARIARQLKKRGMNDITTEILPVNGQQDSKVYVSFKSFRAEAPPDCGMIEDIDGSSAKKFRKYELGCSTQAYLARQVTRPRDLLGREAQPTSGDTRRQINDLEAYKWGTGYAPEIEGEATTSQ